MKKMAMFFVFTAILISLPKISYASSIGIYCWLLSPTPGQVCFDVDDKGIAYGLHGTALIPGSAEIPVFGAANYDNSTGSIFIKLDILGADFFGTIHPVTLNGTWETFGDSPQSGDMLFLRPVIADDPTE